MKIQNSLTKTARTVAAAYAFSLAAVSTSQAAFVSLPSPTPEIPGALLGGLTATGGGTIIDSLSVPFLNAFNGGTFNSWVVDRNPGAGVLLDFYYQILNTTAVPPPDPLGGEEIWRFKSIGGFSGLTVSAAQTDISPVTGLPSLGLQPARTADRDEGSLGSVGFEFPVAPGFPVHDPLNIDVGEASTFLVVRTDSSTYGFGTAALSSGDTSIVNTFVADGVSVPETGGTAVIALTVIGTCLAGYRRKSPAFTN